MFVSKLSLTNFRNYRHLDLALPEGVIVVHGGNAQGKTNLLESIYLLATARSPRAGADGEMIRWDISDSELPLALVAAEVRRARNDLKVEVVISGLKEGAFLGGKVSAAEVRDPKAKALSAQKRIRVNGLPHNAIDLLGQVNVVMFGPQDLDLVSGPPALRRRYLDITLCQVDSHYTKALQRYNRVLVQRNNLLRIIREGQGQISELDFWDDALIESGSYIVFKRRLATGSMEGRAKDAHRELTGGQEELGMTYVGTVGLEKESRNPEEDMASLRLAFRDALEKARPKEVSLGQSIVGPHRDDVEFVIDGMKAEVYASRGQQRTVALALKLAEAHFIEEKSADKPVLLLDDVLSELDRRRRRFLLDTIGSYHQLLITTTDLDRFEPRDLASSLLLRVNSGNVERSAKPNE